MDPVTGAVVIAGLQKFGGPSAELVKDFLNRVLSPTGDALGSALAHPILEWQKRRVERGRKLLEDAAAALQKRNEQPQPVPARVLMPLLERGSLEEDEELRERWVALLASAAVNPEGIIPAFVTMLGELSPAEARILTHVHRTLTRTAAAGVWRHDLASHFVGAQSYIASSHLDILIQNLERLGLVKMDHEHPWADGSIRLTMLGYALVGACSGNEAVSS
jgi:hypothetical protein